MRHFWHFDALLELPLDHETSPKLGHATEEIRIVCFQVTNGKIQKKYGKILKIKDLLTNLMTPEKWITWIT